MKAVITFLCLVAFCNAGAQEIHQNDIQSLLYIKASFGGQNKADRDDSVKLGFTINHTQTSFDQMGRSVIDGRTFKRSLLDIEFSNRTRYFSKFRIGNVDALRYRTVMNADGEGIQWPAGLSTPQVVAIAILGVGLGYYIIESNSDD